MSSRGARTLDHEPRRHRPSHLTRTPYLETAKYCRPSTAHPPRSPMSLYRIPRAVEARDAKCWRKDTTLVLGTLRLRAALRSQCA
jgi:hypothetical protein